MTTQHLVEEDSNKIQKNNISYTLEVNFGDSNKPDLKQFSLEKGKSIVIGRTDCDININKQTISKKHALIEVHDGVYFLQDLESSNKTKIYQNKDTKEYYSLKPKRYYQILPNNKLKFGDVEAIFLAHTKEVKEIEKVQKIEEKPKEIIEENIESLSKESSPPTKKVFFEEATQNYQNSYDEEKKQNNIFENTQNYHNSYEEATQNYSDIDPSPLVPSKKQNIFFDDESTQNYGELIVEESPLKTNIEGEDIVIQPTASPISKDFDQNLSPIKQEKTPAKVSLYVERSPFIPKENPIVDDDDVKKVLNFEKTNETTVDSDFAIDIGDENISFFNETKNISEINKPSQEEKLKSMFDKGEETEDEKEEKKSNEKMINDLLSIQTPTPTPTVGIHFDFEGEYHQESPPSGSLKNKDKKEEFIPPEKTSQDLSLEGFEEKNEKSQKRDSPDFLDDLFFQSKGDSKKSQNEDKEEKREEIKEDKMEENKEKKCDETEEEKEKKGDETEEEKEKKGDETEEEKEEKSDEIEEKREEIKEDKMDENKEKKGDETEEEKEQEEKTLEKNKNEDEKQEIVKDDPKMIEEKKEEIVLDKNPNIIEIGETQYEKEEKTEEDKKEEIFKSKKIVIYSKKTKIKKPPEVIKATQSSEEDVLKRFNPSGSLDEEILDRSDESIVNKEEPKEERKEEPKEDRKELKEESIPESKDSLNFNSMKSQEIKEKGEDVISQTVSILSSESQNKSQGSQTKPTRGRKRKEKVEEEIQENKKVKRTPVIMFTGIDEKERDNYKKMIKKLKGEFTEEIKDVTHLVTDKVHRTVKFLISMNTSHIVSLKWLLESNKKKKILPEEDYILIDKTAEEKYGFSMVDALKRKKELNEKNLKILTGLNFYVTSNVTPPKEDFIQIIESAGGSIKKENCYLISCDEDKKECKEMKVSPDKIYSKEFIFSSILNQKIDFNKNRLIL